MNFIVRFILVLLIFLFTSCSKEKVKTSIIFEIGIRKFHINVAKPIDLFFDPVIQEYFEDQDIDSNGLIFCQQQLQSS